MVTSTSTCQLLETQYPELAYHPWDNLTPPLQQQLQKLGLPTREFCGVVYPQSQTELSQFLALANEHQWPIVPMGSGSKLDWGDIPRSIYWGLSTERVNQLIDHAVGDMTVTAEAGMKLADLQTILAKAGQFLPLDPLYANTTTLGGLIATASSGSLRQRYGGVRDLLLGVTFARRDGQLVKAGGRVVKNVAGYDLMKLLTGSYGTLGVLTQVTFRVYAHAEASQTLALSGNTTALTQVLQQIRDSGLTPTALDVLSPDLAQACGATASPTLFVRFQSIATGVAAQIQQVAQWAQPLGLITTQYSTTDEETLWQQLPTAIEVFPAEGAFLGKIGVKPQYTNLVMDTLLSLLPQPSLIWIQGGSGIGWVRSQALTAEIIQQLRQACTDQGGYLTVLEASSTLKAQLDVWGYTGNALNLMKRLKQQFDPTGILSPGRFVGEI